MLCPTPLEPRHHDCSLGPTPDPLIYFTEPRLFSVDPKCQWDSRHYTLGE